MNVQSEQIKQLIVNIDGALSQSNPRPPLVVMGDTVLHSRQVLEQVRSYLLSLQQELNLESSAELNSPSAPSENLPESLKQFLQQEFTVLHAQIIQGFQQEIKTLQQNQARLLQEIRHLQGEQKSSPVPIPDRPRPPLPLPFRPKIPLPPPPASRQFTVLPTPPKSEEFMPDGSADMLRQPPQHSSISPVISGTDLPWPSVPETPVLKTPVLGSNDLGLEIGLEPLAELRDIFGQIDLDASQPQSQDQIQAHTLATPVVQEPQEPDLEEEYETWLQEDYIHASPDEDLLPTQDTINSISQVESRFLVEKQTLEQLEVDLMSLEQPETEEQTQIQLGATENQTDAETGLSLKDLTLENVLSEQRLNLGQQPFDTLGLDQPDRDELPTLEQLADKFGTEFGTESGELDDPR
ncbi:MAG: hypothetical protein ACRC8A_18780 [Microcoleaceae cyanobacterium]